MAVDKQVIDGLLDEFGVARGSVTISTDIIDVILKKYIDKWQKNLAKKKHIASGNLYQSFALDQKGEYGFKVETSKGKTSITLSLPDYYEFTDTGRGKSSKNEGNVVYNKLQGLKGWISQKGLKLNTSVTQKRKLKDGTIKQYTYKITKAQANKNAAFAIARKIHTKGFKGTNWFTSEKDKFINEIVKAIEKETGVVAELVIDKIAQDINKK